MNFSKRDMAKVNKAYEWVTKHANGEARKYVFQVSQEQFGPYPYWGHQNSVFEQLIVLGIKDINVLLAGILHDVVEDHDVSLVEIEDEFGSDVKSIVDLCSKPAEFNNSTDSIKTFYNRIWDHLKVNESQALGAMQIKICDRIVNLIGVQFIQDDEKKKFYIIESEKYLMPMAKEAKCISQLQNALDFAIEMSKSD